MEDMAASSGDVADGEVMSPMGRGDGGKAAVTLQSDTPREATQPAQRAHNPPQAHNRLQSKPMPDDIAKVEYAFPVDKVHGKVGKKHKIGFAHLTSTGKNFTVYYGKRSTPLKQSELDQQAKFKAVCAAARERMIDPNFMDIDQLNFTRQTKYKTLWGYVFKLCWDAYASE